MDYTKKNIIKQAMALEENPYTIHYFENFINPLMVAFSNCKKTTSPKLKDLLIVKRILMELKNDEFIVKNINTLTIHQLYLKANLGFDINYHINDRAYIFI